MIKYTTVAMILGPNLTIHHKDFFFPADDSKILDQTSAFVTGVGLPLQTKERSGDISTS